MRICSLISKNVSFLVNWGAEQCQEVSSSPQLDAEILLTHAINKPRSYCRTWPDKELSNDEIERYKQLISLRLQPTPIAYIVGYKEFWSRDFKVDSSTLIPRPETELLIEKALDFLEPHQQPQSILDLGTGSGCIAITLQLEKQRHQVMATDMSSDALYTAKMNAQLLEADITFLQSSWFSDIPNEQAFNLIVSNPPYIPNQDEHLISGDLPAEPITALASGEDGLDDIRIITQQALNYLTDHGMLLIEHGYDQKESVFACFKEAGFGDIQQHDDLAGQARLTSGIKKS